MKKFLPIMFLILSASVFSQIVKPTPDKEQSKLEAFSARSGTVIERQFIDIGEVRGVKVQVYKVTDLVSKTNISGVRFEYTVRSQYSSDDKVAVLDSDEVDGLIKTIDMLKATVFPSTRDSYTEVEYRSRSGFEAGGYYSDKKWTAFLKLEKYDSKSMVIMRTEDLDALVAILQLGKEKMGK
ncbi:MAG TPA: hypothetical protein PLL77_04520 [Pyrinomonadaceae bacterium]|nr:hypothetical protein [Pyrinomonadaceae bacterium]